MPPRPASQPFVIRDRKRVRALESPVRQEIVDALAAGGAATMAQIGAWLGRRPDALYYHVAALLRVGLLREVDRRRAGKRFCAVYDVPGRPLLIRMGTGSGGRGGGGEAAPEDVARVVRSTLRLADRDMRRAMAAGLARFDDAGPDRNLWAGRVRGWVAPSDLKRLGELIAELGELLRNAPPAQDDSGDAPVAYSFTYVASPVAARSAGTRKNRAASKARKGAKR